MACTPQQYSSLKEARYLTMARFIWFRATDLSVLVFAVGLFVALVAAGMVFQRSWAAGEAIGNNTNVRENVAASAATIAFAVCIFLSNSASIAVRAITTNGSAQPLILPLVLASGFSVAIISGVTVGFVGFLVNAVLFLLIALCGYLGRVVAAEKRKNLGMWLGLLFGPLGVLIAAVLRSD
jgi:hypothetical protein